MHLERPVPVPLFSVTTPLVADGPLSQDRLPTPLDVDPWWDVYLPAVHGDEVSALEAAQRALASVTPDRAGSLAAVVARALFVTRRSAEARQLLARALRFGGDEVLPLAILLAPDGRALALDAVRGPGLAGERADRACDLAVRCLWDRDPDAARSAVALATTVCPSHREAARWGRFFRIVADPVAAVRRARRREVPAEDLAQRDADALTPLRATGYLSEERLRRRLYGVAGGFEPAGGAPGTSLGTLAQAGLHALRFGFPHQYRRRPADDPRVALELLADDAESLLAEGRDATRPVAALWRRAGGEGSPVRAEVARLLLTWASRDDRLGAWGVEAVLALRAIEPGDAARWDAAEALVGRILAPDRAVRLARSVVKRPHEAPEVWRMALDALRLSGHPDEARAEARRRVGAAGLGAEALRFLAAPPTSPPEPYAPRRLAGRA